ncbi:MAG: DUF881 domain-containing protein [Clostridiales bacterium]|jgi:uncharacterized protein YlxW (UPF0749 family)|nr:DUF881 domain-containing protein [Eubacteriales bacterium]MDH7565341.1 DUF881 domain-containing protein [Clostridiales bacterium]
MRLSDRKFIFLVIFFLLGIAFTLQVRSTIDANRQKTATSLNIEKLKAQLSEEEKSRAYLEKLIDENEKKKEAYLKANVENKNDEQLKELKRELDSIKLMGGLTDVKGPGVIISLDDAAIKSTDTQIDYNDYLIHDIDVVRILNNLKGAGAQAIAVNGERIIATSEQVCAGPTIRINKSRYAVPYEIKAIGDPDLLYESLNKSEAVALMLEFKIKVEITKSKEIFIPKYNKNLDSLISALEVDKQ